MARKEIDITITDEGRDKGKIFHIREMDADRAERWAARVLLAMAKGGVEIPEGFEDQGLLGVFVTGLNSLKNLTFPDAAELMDEMFTCISIRPDPRNAPDFLRHELLSDDIEEVATRVKLRAEVLNLHTGFSLAALKSRFVSMKRAAA
jgi:hypothetical protein